MTTQQIKKNYLSEPFRHLSTKSALTIGLIGLLVMGELSYFSKMHNDGVFDLHSFPLSFSKAIVMPFIWWLITSIFVWLGAMIVRKSKVRLIDTLAYMSVARMPLLIGVLSGFVFDWEGISLEGLQLTLPMVIGILVCTIAFILTVYMTWQVFKLCANKSGAQSVIVFILTVIIASALKIVIQPAFLDNSEEASVQTTVSEVPSNHEAIIKDVAEKLKANDFAGVVSYFNAEMSSQLPTDQLQAVTEELTKYFGNILGHGEVQAVSQTAEYTVYIVDFMLEQKTFKLKVTIDKEDKIAGLFIN